MTEAQKSEQPTSDAPLEHAREPAQAGIDTAGRLIKAGLAVIAISCVGYGI